ncbi:hypothetical protein [Deinococcus pimensis]|uniref:hypothetical protein n=1 Tax=Deinococcus pimensis TaxID=309888 RepID=UPI000487A777|nr:hypothetical protein [Deinococcus pimensis]
MLTTVHCKWTTEGRERVRVVAADVETETSLPRLVALFGHDARDGLLRRGRFELTVGLDAAAWLVRRIADEDALERETRPLRTDVLDA